MVTTPAVVGAIAALSFTLPKYEVRVERDVVYAQARGYWTKADEEEGMAIGRLYNIRNGDKIPFPAPYHS